MRSQPPVPQWSCTVSPLHDERKSDELEGRTNLQPAQNVSLGIRKRLALLEHDRPRDLVVVFADEGLEPVAFWRGGGMPVSEGDPHMRSTRLLRPSGGVRANGSSLEASDKQPRRQSNASAAVLPRADRLRRRRRKCPVKSSSQNNDSQTDLSMTACRLRMLESFHSSNASSALSTARLRTCGVDSGTRVRTRCVEGSWTSIQCVESPVVYSPPIKCVVARCPSVAVPLHGWVAASASRSARARRAGVVVKVRRVASVLSEPLVRSVWDSIVSSSSG